MSAAIKIFVMLFFLIILSGNDAKESADILIRSKRSAPCPPVNQVRGPPCREDYDCRKGPCCPNSLGKKSCVDTVPFRRSNAAVSSSSRCPPVNQVRGPPCREDYDCKRGPCCPNSMGRKSCVNT